MRLPTFVIIGAQKAATTTLEGWLSAHPDVWMPETEDAYFRDPLYRQRTLEEFARQYAGRDADVLGLKCPDYLGRPEVAQRLAKDLKLPRLLVSLRDPVRRAVSAYFWNMRWGTIPVADPNVGLRTILNSSRDPTNPNAWEVLDWGLYAKHLRRYLATFPPERIHVLFEEDLRRRPVAAWRATAQFLHVDPEKVGHDATMRSRNEGIYSLTRLRFLQIRKPVVLRRDPETGYATIPKSPSPVVRTITNAIAAADHYLLRPWCTNAPPPLDPDVEAQLREFYRPDVLALQDLLSRDLSEWLG